MSLYNEIAGVDQNADVLLGVIGCTMKAFERFRDIHLNADGTKVIVLTRCGGGNRADYWRMFELMAHHPYYIKDYDDDYDNTYAYIEFSIPERYQNMCKHIATGKDPKSIKEIFDEEIKNMDIPGTDAYNRAMNFAKTIEQAIKAAEEGNDNNGGINIIKL